MTSTLDLVGASAATMLRRLRIIATGSAVVEDIEDYGRVYQLFSELLPPQRRFTNLLENWGGENGAVGSVGIPE